MHILKMESDPGRNPFGRSVPAEAHVSISYADAEFLAETLERHQRTDMETEKWVKLREDLLNANREFLRIQG